jgi:hypothetical protein
MTSLAPKLYPEDVRRVTRALIAALLEIVDGVLPNEPIDVDYILYKPKDLKYVKITLTQVTPDRIRVAFTLENGSSATYGWRRNQFGKWVQLDDANVDAGNGPSHWMLTGMDEVRALTHAVLVVRGLIRDSEDE